VVGIGGIATWHDAVEFIMAGAHAVQIGSAIFANPNVAKEILCGLKAFMKSHGYATLEEMRGIAQ
ncbi:MAG: dihydroorotate dehydrogenase, partial [Treponema sp.]|nr:dihydroorotate dehydrogenase [Treponema sp.]